MSKLEQITNALNSPEISLVWTEKFIGVPANSDHSCQDFIFYIAPKKALFEIEELNLFLESLKTKINLESTSDSKFRVSREMVPHLEVIFGRLYDTEPVGTITRTTKINLTDYGGFSREVLEKTFPLFKPFKKQETAHRSIFIEIAPCNSVLLDSLSHYWPYCEEKGLTHPEHPRDVCDVLVTDLAKYSPDPKKVLMSYYLKYSEYAKGLPNREKLLEMNYIPYDMMQSENTPK